MQISFYILGERFASPDMTQSTSTASDNEAVLKFICQLTQTVLKKSEHSLIIIDDNGDRLRKLDQQLWSFDPVSFIPHNLIPASVKGSTSNLISDADTIVDTALSDNANDKTLPNMPTIDTESLSAPVTLVSALPHGFDGVVINLAVAPLPLSSTSAHPERVLEIIAPDPISKEQGRDKYRFYRDLNLKLTSHSIK